MNKMGSITELGRYLVAEIGSRKFRAFLGGILMAIASALTETQSWAIVTQQVILLCLGYMGFVALEDGLKGQ